MWLMVEELDERIVTGSPMRFPESSGKTSHIVSHSRSISAIPFFRLTRKEEVVKVRSRGKSVGGSKGLNGLRTGSLQWG